MKKKNYFLNILVSMNEENKISERIEDGYQKALECLRENSHSMGFVASPERHANYYSIWARDHCITTIAAYLSEDKELMATGLQGVKQLLKHQLDNGQIPSYIEIESGKAVYGGYGRITSIDSNMWLMIAVALIYNTTNNKTLISEKNIERYKEIYSLLRAADLDKCGLIEVHTSGDWADIINRSYHVLYDEVLYFESLRATSFLFKEALDHTKLKYEYARRMNRRRDHIKERIKSTKLRINDAFWFTEEKIPEIIDEYMIHTNIPKKNYPFYQSHLMPFLHNWAHRVDTFGNILALSSTLSSKERKDEIIDYILKNKINEPVPMRALYPVIKEGDLDWINIYEKKEPEHTYHNGGIWPLIGGFWIYSLVHGGYQDLAQQEMEKLTDYFEKIDWTFPEHIHAETLKPLGRKKQAWSAAAYIIAYQALYNKKRVFHSWNIPAKMWEPKNSKK